jgi:hypothetical protein
LINLKKPKPVSSVDHSVNTHRNILSSDYSFETFLLKATMKIENIVQAKKQGSAAKKACSKRKEKASTEQFKDQSLSLAYGDKEASGQEDPQLWSPW